MKLTKQQAMHDSLDLGICVQIQPWGVLYQYSGTDTAPPVDISVTSRNGAEFEAEALTPNGEAFLALMAE